MAKNEPLRSADESASEAAHAHQRTDDVSVLVEQARAGDHAAFETLVERFQTPVRLYLAHLVGDDEQARDRLPQIRRASCRERV